MEHLTDKQLLVLLEVSGEPDDLLKKHLDGCESCQERWQALCDPWNALGQWTLDGTETKTDLTDRILGQIPSESTIFLWQSQAWVRIAASVIIGVGVGALLGRSGATTVSAEEASQAIYLDVLALESSTGWTAPLLVKPQEP